MSSIDIKSIFGRMTQDDSVSFMEFVKALPHYNVEDDSVHASFALRPEEDENRVTLMITECPSIGLDYREDILLTDRKKGEESLWGPIDRRVRATLTASLAENNSVTIEIHHYDIEEGDLRENIRSSKDLKDHNFTWRKQSELSSVPDLITDDNHKGLRVLSDLLIRYAWDHPAIGDKIEAGNKDKWCRDLGCARAVDQLYSKKFSNG